MKLENTEQAIIISHVIRRIFLAYKPHERTASIEKVIKTSTKYLVQREKHNISTYDDITKLEAILWEKVVASFTKPTLILKLDLICRLYGYFPNLFNKNIKISDKLMDKISILSSSIEVKSDEMFEMEQNNDDVISIFIEIFEPYSGASLKKSLFSGKKLTIKNNLILEGNTLDKRFA